MNTFSFSSRLAPLIVTVDIPTGVVIKVRFVPVAILRSLTDIPPCADQNPELPNVPLVATTEAALKVALAPSCCACTVPVAFRPPNMRTSS